MPGRPSMTRGGDPKRDFPTSSWPRHPDLTGTKEYTLHSKTRVLGMGLWEGHGVMYVHTQTWLGLNNILYSRTRALSVSL